MLIKKKKALSPVVATALLIALAVALAAIVFFWTRGFLSEQIEKRGEPITKICEAVNMEVEFIGNGNKLELSITNIGSIPISSVEITQETKNHIKSNVWNISANSFGQNSKVELNLEDNIIKIGVSPRVIGSVRGKEEQKEVTCSTKTKYKGF